MRATYINYTAVNGLFLLVDGASIYLQVDTDIQVALTLPNPKRNVSELLYVTSPSCSTGVRPRPRSISAALYWSDV